MLRRKLLLIFGSLLILLVVMTTGIIWAMQGLLDDIEHINDQATSAVTWSEDLTASINAIELELHRLRAGDTRHLNRLLDEIDATDELLDAGADHYLVEHDPIAPLYVRVRKRFPQFVETVTQLATVDRAEQHQKYVTALTEAMALHDDLRQIHHLARAHKAAEETELAARFRTLVLAVTIGFLVVLNASILFLLRSASMVLQPVGKLVEACRQLAVENFEHRTHLDQADEFSELARAYNDLAERLQTAEAHRMEVIGQVAVTLNHELNNAMAVIVSQLALLERQSGGNPRAEAHLRRIQEGLHRMAETVDALKRVRRIVVAEYGNGEKMLDLDRSVSDESPANRALTGIERHMNAAAREWTEPHWHLALSGELRWFVRLRWAAAAATIVGAAVNKYWLQWYDHSVEMFFGGVGILAFNVLFWLSLRVVSRMPGAKLQRLLLPLAGVQVLLDLTCLGLLTAWTGGVHSPLLGFFIFHMVFASLLMPWRLALASPAVAGLILLATLAAVGHWPMPPREGAMFIGWLATLLMTTFLANHIIRNLRANRRKAMEMSEQLHSQERAMMQQEKMAAMGQMAAGVAHEIANPLACMDSMLQLIQRNPAKIDAETIRKLRNQIERISTIVKGMTHFAHPREALIQDIEAAELIARALELLRFDPRVGRTEIEVKVAPDAPAVTVQPQAVEQVLVNLALNSLDAMAGIHPPRLTVRAERRGEFCAIEITDNGHGIDPEHLDHIFEPFFTTKPPGKGTGLGLSISYSLTSNQGGRIEADNAPTGGARFTVLLPLAKTGNREPGTGNR